MRKSLLTLSLALLLGGAAMAVAATQAEAPNAQIPMLLAQASPQPFTRPLPPPEGRGPAGRRVQRSPEQMAERRQAMCEDRADRLAGQLAYLEARLDLTTAQRDAFARWRDIRMADAQRQARTCAERPVAQGRGAAASPPNPVERMARQEEMLRQRLADLQAQRPALEALYNSLSPEQRQKFTPDAGARRMGRGGMRPRLAIMRDRLIQRGPMTGGRDGRGPGMMPPPGGAPAPVPPAQ
jgi:hypothetical protein